MNLLQKTERLLKQNWKERKRITLAVIVSFLINGGVGYATEELETLQTESLKKDYVDIKPKDQSIGIHKDTRNNGIIVDINKPDTNGISHNEYDVFNMQGQGAKILFNNTDQDMGVFGEDPLGFKEVKGNRNYASGEKATLIISEITGENNTNLIGNLEVRTDDKNINGPFNVDLIFANENGINVNGITYYGVDHVMYVNDRDWANKDILSREIPKGETDEVHLFGGDKGQSQGATHKGKKDNNTYYSGQTVGWTIKDGISANTKKLEEEKRRLEEERERLEREKQERERLKKEQEQQEQERFEREKQKREKQKKEREQQERERVKREKHKREKQKKEQEQQERERLEREKQKKERLKKEQEQQEQERLEREKQERERLKKEQEQQEQERLEREKKKRERLKKEQEKQEQESLEREKQR